MAIIAELAPGMVAPRVLIRQGSGVAMQLVIAAVCVALVGVALVPALLQAFLDKPLYSANASFTLRNFIRLVVDPDIRGTFGATALFCLVVVAVSMSVGAGLAILVGRTDLPGRGWLLSALLWPLFISPQIIGFAAIMSYGPSGFVTGLVGDLLGVDLPWDLDTVPGIGLIAGIAAASMTLLYWIRAVRQQDPDHEAAGRVAGAGPARILRRISLAASASTTSSFRGSNHTPCNHCVRFGPRVAATPATLVTGRLATPYPDGTCTRWTMPAFLAHRLVTPKPIIASDRW
jgi:ABC-type Fe3+ transport system permease subunit